MVAPHVKAASGYSHGFTQGLHRICFLLRLNELVYHFSSLAKKATACAARPFLNFALHFDFAKLFTQLVDFPLHLE